MLTIRTLTMADASAFDLAISQIPPELPTFLHHFQRGMALKEYIRTLADYQRGMVAGGLVVPTSFLFGFSGSKIVGRVSIRHQLTPKLPDAGHIGYVVLSAFRARGYATEMLKMAVQHAYRVLKIRPVLVTCDRDNAASIKVIERNGGVLQRTSAPPDRAAKLHYSIDVKDQSAKN